ncbi:MAG: lysophospholipid acyltransferase family protein, partial [Alphaproteobacteria bacterium]
TIVKDPIYILKQELIRLPLYGRFLKKMGMIAIDRSGGAKTLKQLIRGFKDSVKLNRPFILFPEGTRTNIGQSIDYQIGIAAIYDLKILPIIPTALNSGLFWPKSSIKQKGKSIIKFLPAIENGLAREEFMKQLQNNIENESNRLCGLSQ